MTRVIAGLVACGAALIVCSPAAATQVTATNACWWAFPGTWSTETFSLTGTASPAQSTGAGTPITLSGTTATITLPRAVIESGVGLGVLNAGENEIAIRAWLAIRGENTVEGIQTRETTATTRTTIVLGPEGEVVSATPLAVVGTFGDTQWTAASTAPVAFAQAGAGSLAGLPVRQAQPGSIHVTASLGSLSLQIECQPGTRAGSASAPAPAAAPVFATVAGPPGSAAPPPAIKPKDPRLALRTSKLKVDKKGRVTVRLACSDAPCSGTVAVLNAVKKAVTNRLRYSLTAGQAKSYTLRLTAGTRKVLRGRSLSVRVTTAPSAGEPLASKRVIPRTR